ncbi:MAG TPA: hypothetical protein VI876_11380 [Dehalococcoidia bacterium]|nr:hypothetical protein [Dehalococcoidia bacterium]
MKTSAALPFLAAATATAVAFAVISYFYLDWRSKTDELTKERDALALQLDEANRQVDAAGTEAQQHEPLFTPAEVINLAMSWPLAEEVKHSGQTLHSLGSLVDTVALELAPPCSQSRPLWSARVVGIGRWEVAVAMPCRIEQLQWNFFEDGPRLLPINEAASVIRLK